MLIYDIMTVTVWNLTQVGRSCGSDESFNPQSEKKN